MKAILPRPTVADRSVGQGSWEVNPTCGWETRRGSSAPHPVLLQHPVLPPLPQGPGFSPPKHIQLGIL